MRQHGERERKKKERERERERNERSWQRKLSIQVAHLPVKVRWTRRRRPVGTVAVMVVDLRDGRKLLWNEKEEKVRKIALSSHHTSKFTKMIHLATTVSYSFVFQNFFFCLVSCVCYGSFAPIRCVVTQTHNEMSKATSKSINRTITTALILSNRRSSLSGQLMPSGGDIRL